MGVLLVLLASSLPASVAGAQNVSNSSLPASVAGAQNPSTLQPQTRSAPLETSYMRWTTHSELPEAPRQEVQPGLAGAFSGTINGKVVVAGGANFPQAMPWEGGERIYHSDVYVYRPGQGGRGWSNEQGSWSVLADALPEARAYGATVALEQGLLLIGGRNRHGITGEVLLMQIEPPGEQPAYTRWPDLPVPLAHMTAARVGHQLFVAGGQQQLTDGAAGNHFYVLDLQRPQNGWQPLAPWPGPPRAFAVSAAQSDGFDTLFYLFSGRNYGPDQPVEVLTDGYSYNPRLNTWTELEPPSQEGFAVMAGAAAPSGQNHILLVGGDDGERMLRYFDNERQRDRIKALLQSSGADRHSRAEPARIRELEEQLAGYERRLLEHFTEHPGFSNSILFYHTITNTLVEGSVAGAGLPVTTNLFAYDNGFLMPSGEISPGVRTPQVLYGEFTLPQLGFGRLNTVVISLYFLLLAGMGWYFSRKQRNTDDYFRGAGQMPWWVVGLSIFGTALSAITFMAIPAKSYATDWSYIVLNIGIVVVAPIIIALCIPIYRKLDITTAYEYLEQRFNAAARLVGSLSFILFQIGRMGVVLFLPAIAINVVTGLDLVLSILLMGVFSLAYTMMGGIMAVIWTDALQVVVLLGGALLAVYLIIVGVDGGLGSIVALGAEAGKLHLGDAAVDFRDSTLVTMGIAAFFTALITYGTDQTMVQRYVTTPSPKEASKSIWTNALLSIPATLIFFFVGTALWVYYSANPLELSPTLTGGDAIFPWFIFTQMPQGISGLLIAGIFAAAMSTLSSSMNSAATAWSIDIHQRLGWDRRFGGLLQARVATLVLGIAGIGVGLLMASMDITSLWDEFNRILGLVLGGLGGLFFLGLLTTRAHGPGAMVGLAVSVVVQIILSQQGTVHLMLFATTGFVSCFTAGYLASILTPHWKKECRHLTIYARF